ncbi:hypothetical protein EDC22_101390 [Tepidamorphus gemmatus]|jgi:VIT1/CCC1 family predicted Fe2+/Mn2+ transporter|uniref:Uncharacterized protein n=1 Tax=Tepidamorphus gemmatus TaxID=747076 RepID=A0A4R3MIQ5_9HYPH|nr:hypothetical protein EDC22_101390 [Tepidamorphus gemmatus]
MPRTPTDECHLVHRIGRLRAAVAGPIDGMVVAVSLTVVVADAGSGRTAMLAPVSRFGVVVE